MIRILLVPPRTRRLLLLAIAVIGSFLTLAHGEARAAGNGPVLSASAGAAHARIRVTDPACVGGSTTGSILTARLLTGSGPNARQAARAVGYDGSPAVLVVPDWADPAAVAVVETRCEVLDLLSGTTSAGPLLSVGFDVTPSTTRPTQAQSVSRTNLLAGQAYRTSGTGCETGAGWASTNLWDADDATGRSLTAGEGLGGGQVANRQFGHLVWTAGSSVELEMLPQQGGGVAITSVEETSGTATPGFHTATTSCAGVDGAELQFAPTRIHIDGVAPVDQIDLVRTGAGPVDRGIRLQGSACAAGRVRVLISTASASDLLGGRTARGGSTGSVVTERVAATDALGVGPGTRSALATPDVDVTVSTDPAGAWHVDHVSPFDGTFATGAAICGDPERTGFVYSIQGLVLPGSAPLGSGGGEGSD